MDYCNLTGESEMPVEKLGFYNFNGLLRSYLRSNFNVIYEKSENGKKVLRFKNPYIITQDLVQRIQKWSKNNQVPKNIIFEDSVESDLVSDSEEEVQKYFIYFRKKKNKRLFIYYIRFSISPMRNLGMITQKWETSPMKR